MQIEVDGQIIEIEQRDGRFVKPDILKRLSGYNVALKPAWEPCIVAMKPIEGTFAHNALKWGVAGMNVDGTRIPTNGETPGGSGNPSNPKTGNGNVYGEYKGNDGNITPPQGRWPANLVLDGSAEVTAGFPTTTSMGHFPKDGKTGEGNVYGKFNGSGKEESHTDTGSAARFFQHCPPDADAGDAEIVRRYFYTAKSSKSERDAGLDIDLAMLDSIVLICYNGSIFKLSEVLLWGKAGQNQSTDSNGEALPQKDISEVMTQLQVNNDLLITSNGNAPTGLFLKGIKFITSTGTRQTIELKILDSLLRLSTNASTEDAIRILMEYGLSLVESAVLRNLLKLITTNVFMVYRPGANGAVLKMQSRTSARDALLKEGAHNFHSTVKPLALTEYLARLILPPPRDTPRRLLVPFAGSMSEVIGALRAGWDEVVAIELDADYCAIGVARIQYWQGVIAEERAAPTQGALF